jgi:hypothetical protein
MFIVFLLDPGQQAILPGITTDAYVQFPFRPRRILDGVTRPPVG